MKSSNSFPMKRWGRWIAAGLMGLLPLLATATESEQTQISGKASTTQTKQQTVKDVLKYIEDNSENSVNTT